MKVKDCKEEFKVKGYTNKWSIINESHGYVMLENSTWGDETNYLVIPGDAEVINRPHKRRDGNYTIIPTVELEEEKILETFDDIDTCLEDNDII